MARRLLLLTTDLEIGGTPTVVRELATRLRDPGRVEVDVASLKPSGPVGDQIRDAGIRVTSFGANRAVSLPSTVSRLRSLVRERSIDTVVSFLIHANTVAALASRKLQGVRFFQSIQTTQPRPRWHWSLQGWAQRSAERLFVPSNAIVEKAIADSRIDRARFVVIPNAIEPAEFPVRGAFGHRPLRVGFVGRLDPVKRVDVAIRAVELLGRGAKLLVFGEGRKPALESSRVEWRGVVASPQQAMREIDVLALPSIGEGFGLVLIEAMASGVPVVASAAGGIVDVVQDGINGLLVPVEAGEVRNFARSIERLRDDPALREAIIGRGLAAVRERYSWDVVLPAYRRLFDIC